MHERPESLRWMVLASVGVGTFMSALDGSVVNTILPVISSAMRSPIDAVQWIISIYLLVVSGLLLTFGRLGDLRGHKEIYMIGFGIFAVSSGACGFAPSIAFLNVFRGVQALGAAMLFANAPAILVSNFPPRLRGRVLGILGSMTYLGLSAGPSLGGWLTVHFGWRSVFFINVPLAALALWLSARYIPHDSRQAAKERFDIPGTLTFILGLIALLLALNQGYAWGWRSTPVCGLLIFAVTMLLVFGVIENRSAAPMVDFTLFQRRLFSAATIAATLNYICISCITFLLPFYLIQGRGLNPAQAGLLLTAQPLVMVIAAPISGTTSDRIGARIPGTVGMLILSIGLFLLARLEATASFSTIAMALGVAGLGTGIFVSPNNSSLMGSAPLDRQGIASGILATARNVGMVLGVGLAGAVLTTFLIGSAAHDSGALYHAVSIGFLIAAGIALLGAFVSLVRGSNSYYGTREPELGASPRKGAHVK